MFKDNVFMYLSSFVSFSADFGGLYPNYVSRAVARKKLQPRRKTPKSAVSLKSSNIISLMEKKSTTFGKILPRRVPRFASYWLRPWYQSYFGDSQSFFGLEASFYV